MNALVIALGLETGFIGAWCCGEDVEDVLRAYSLNPFYSFDHRLLIDFAQMPTHDNDDPHKTFRFKCSLKSDSEILVHSFDSNDLLLLTCHVTDNSVMSSARTVPLSISRYIIHKRPSLKDLPSSFRNLRELSIKLKNELFLPLRDEILGDSMNHPSLTGIPFDTLYHIGKFLSRKDLLSLSSACKNLRKIKPPSIQMVLWQAFVESKK